MTAAPVTLIIPAALRAHCGGEARVAVTASTVRDALEAVGRLHDDFLQHVLTRDGQLRPFVKIFVREDDVLALDGLDTPLHAGEEVAIVPSVAGG